MLLTEEAFILGKVKETPLKASQALRVGIMLRPAVHKREYYFDHNGRSCALAALYEGATGEAPIHLNQRQQWKLIKSYLHERFPGLPMFRIMWRFCVKKHSREKIADWLESRGM